MPIQATTVREQEVDADGHIVRRAGGGEARTGSIAQATASTGGGETTTEELEGVFVVRQERAVFVSIDTGIAGDRYFEAVTGLEVGDRVITGPFEVVRNLSDGDPVQVNDPDADR